MYQNTYTRLRSSMYRQLQSTYYCINPKQQDLFQLCWDAIKICSDWIRVCL